MFLILKSLQILVCLKLAPSGNTLIFGPIPFAPPTLSLTLLLKATEFLSLICLRILLFPIDLWHDLFVFLFIVGEPINAEAWHWYHEVVGEKRCVIVDTWWQTGKNRLSRFATDVNSNCRKLSIT